MAHSTVKVCQALLERHPDLIHQDFSAISGSNADPLSGDASPAARKTRMATHHSSGQCATDWLGLRSYSSGRGKPVSKGQAACLFLIFLGDI